MPYSAPQHNPRKSPRSYAHDDERGSASSRGYGSDWRRIREWYMRRNPLCVECARFGLSVLATDVDHIVPKRHGGTNAASNLQPLCHSCHSRKTARERAGGMRDE